MKKKSSRTYMICIFLLLLTLSSFLAGFTVNELIHSKVESRTVPTLHYHIIPRPADDRPIVKSIIHEDMEV